MSGSLIFCSSILQSPSPPDLPALGFSLESGSSPPYSVIKTTFHYLPTYSLNLHSPHMPHPPYSLCLDYSNCVWLQYNSLGSRFVLRSLCCNTDSVISSHLLDTARSKNFLVLVEVTIIPSVNCSYIEKLKITFAKLIIKLTTRY